MRYTIGCEMIPKKYAPKHKKRCKGLYCFGEYDIPYILQKNTDEKVVKNSVLLVFDSAKEAELYAQILARAYRRDDAPYASRKSDFIRFFYPLKIDSANFGYKIVEIDKEVRTLLDVHRSRKGEDNQTIYDIKQNRFGEVVEKPLGHYRKVSCDLIRLD